MSTAKKPRPLSQTTQPPPTAPKPSQSQDLASEYITMKEMLADLVDLLAGNAPVISQLNNRFFSLSIIPQDVHNAVANPYPTPNERATRLINSLLTIIQTHSNPNSVFSSLITALQKVGLNNMASKLIENLSKIQYYNNYFLFILIDNRNERWSC